MPGLEQWSEQSATMAAPWFYQLSQVSQAPQVPAIYFSDCFRAN